MLRWAWSALKSADEVFVFRSFRFWTRCLQFFFANLLSIYFFKRMSVLRGYLFEDLGGLLLKRFRSNALWPSMLLNLA
jgi:hypothetical protein